MKLDNILKLLLLIILISVITRCKTEPHVEIKESFNLIVTPLVHTFPAEGGELNFEVSSYKITTNISDELIISNKEDIPYTISLSGKDFSLIQSQNKIIADVNEGDERSAVISVAIDGTDLLKKIQLYQKANIKESDSIIRYVSPVSKGKGNGESINDAADFLDPHFWKLVEIGLVNKPCEVKFLAGDYSKAYIEDGLILNGIGNEINKLILTGNDNVIFSLPEGYSDKRDVIRLNNCQNIHLRDLHFTGDGRTEYALRITGTDSKKILIENCSWVDMKGIIYGATGAHQGASNINYRDCIFKRIGFNAGSHMMYHSYGASYIGVFNCHFEDCMGDYVRFRARTDFGIVKESTFIRNYNYPDVIFVAIPCFNDVDPGDEWFGTNFSFTSNKFENKGSSSTTNPISFYHQGYSPKQFNYLLTKTEGELLINGTTTEKNRILKNNFGLDVNKIRTSNNKFSSNILRCITIRSFAAYGATSLGWTGTAEITELINTTKSSFEWEFE